MTIRLLERTMLIATLMQTAWVEWSILTHAGLGWALLFGGLFLFPFAAVATLAFLPQGYLRRDR